MYKESLYSLFNAYSNPQGYLSLNDLKYVFTLLQEPFHDHLFNYLVLFLFNFHRNLNLLPYSLIFSSF